MSSKTTTLPCLQQTKPTTAWREQRDRLSIATLNRHRKSSRCGSSLGIPISLNQMLPKCANDDSVFRKYSSSPDHFVAKSMPVSKMLTRCLSMSGTRGSIFNVSKCRKRMSERKAVLQFQYLLPGLLTNSM